MIRAQIAAYFAVSPSDDFGRWTSNLRPARRVRNSDYSSYSFKYSIGCNDQNVSRPLQEEDELIAWYAAQINWNALNGNALTIPNIPQILFRWERYRR